MENKREYFLVEYPLWEIDVHNLHSIFEQVKSSIRQFSECPVLMLPNIFQLHELTGEQLLEIRNMIDEIMEKKHDINNETGART